MSKFTYLTATFGLATLYIIASCSGGDLSSSGERKEAKKKRTETDGETQSQTDESSDASQPQVVTGAYLACIQDGTSSSGETNFGCTVINQADNKKMDIGQRKLNITATDSTGTEINSRFTRDSAQSNFHGHVAIPAANGTNVKFKGDLDGSTLSAVDFIYLSDDLEASKLVLNKDRYTKEQRNAWCAISTTLTLSNADDMTCRNLGTACGGQLTSSRCNSSKFWSKFLGSQTQSMFAVCKNPAFTSFPSEFKKNCDMPK